MVDRVIRHEFKPSRVCIDAYDDKRFQGRFSNAALPTERTFSNLMQLILIIEEVMDQLSFPQHYTERRTFWGDSQGTGSKSGIPVKGSEVSEAGKVATFTLKIIFCQNASWQGTLSWLEQNKEENFRSALEMFQLMDDALTAQL